MTLYFENYRRIVEAGKSFPPGVERDKFMYAMAAVMSAHVDPEKLIDLLEQVSRDMTVKV